MPTETFDNLSPAKRKRIFDAAVSEFSERRFSEASINQIIKAAGISRGSFYQYFGDKEDLYLYVLTEIGKEKLAIFGETAALHADADFFAVYEHMVDATLTWARERPLYQRIGLWMDLDDSEFLAKLRQRLPDGTAQMRSLIEKDQRRGLIDPAIEASLIVEMYTVLLTHALKEYYATGNDERMLRQRVADICKIMKEGIARA